MNARRGARLVAFAVVVTAFAFGPGGVASAASNPHSPSFAGYAVDVVPKTATVTFTIPALTCTPTNEGIVPSLAFTNFTTNTFTSAGMYVQCFNGAVDDGALIEINNRFSSLSQNVNAGDTIRLTIKVSAKLTSVAIADLTNNSSVQSVVSGPGGGGSFTGVSVGDSKIGSPGEPVAPFTTLAFKMLKVNGAPMGAGGTLSPTDMYDASTLQIRTGALGPTGTHFTTTFVASS
jgi:hypothetical protein